LENPTKWAPGVVWDPAAIAAAEGHPNHINAVILDTLYFTALGDPANPCKGVTDAERWSTTNPKGVRCTLADYMVNVFGRRPNDDYAGRPLDNVGVEYGLKAFKAGKLSKAQFIDLNVKVGGADINAHPIADRIAADEPALRNAHRSGAINDASNLDQVAIIDLRGSDDGMFHDAYRAFAIRARLDREHGTHANQVIWQGPVPLLGGADFTTKGLTAMDRWLTALERDKRAVPYARKVRESRPADVVDHCETGVPGQIIEGTDCPAVVRVYETPRMVAGESVVTDTNKCRLRPVRRADYASFTDAEFKRYAAVFPDGVCDFSKPGVDSETPTIPWLTYADTIGGRPLPAAAPVEGWAGAAFRGVRTGLQPSPTPPLRVTARRTGPRRVAVTLRATRGSVRRVRVSVRSAGGKRLGGRSLARLTTRSRTVVVRTRSAVGARARVVVSGRRADGRAVVARGLVAR
jgi:hypothetical protein